MAFILIPLTEAMAADVTRIYLDAFATVSANQVMVPERGPRTFAALVELEKKGIRDAESNPDEYLFAVVDTSLPPPTSLPEPAPTTEGQIVGCVKWKRERKDVFDRREVDLIEIPNANLEVRTKFFAMIERLREKIMGDSDYWHLKYLAADPAYGRRGIGRTALQWGIAKADEESLPTYLDATPPGRLLYERFGFEIIEQDSLDLRPYGVDETYWCCSMIRKPQPSAK